MLHLVTRPSWDALSGKVDFPEDIGARYSALISEAISRFESSFAAELASPRFSAAHMVIQPRGLANVKLMCFANASVQLLFASPPFVSVAHFMKTHVGLLSPRQRGVAPSWLLFCQFLDTFNFSDCGSSDGALPSLKSLAMTERVAPTNLRALDAVFGPEFSSQRQPLEQQDAMQFLMFFLNRLHEELLALIRLSPPPPSPDEGAWQVQSTGRGQIRLDETQGAQSPLSQVFLTLQRVDILQNGKSRNVKDEGYLVLPLDIRGCRTVQLAIEAFVSEERIDEALSKRKPFVALPRSLIICLKRFEFDPRTKVSVKLHDFVEYPELLELRRVAHDAPVRYQLCGIVEHSGRSPAGGHYVCHVRRFDGTWMLFNDDRVATIAQGGHLKVQAYLLLYNQITSLRAAPPPPAE
jgi:ubiquitin C-terminal hydrolase